MVFLPVGICPTSGGLFHFIAPLTSRAGTIETRRPAADTGQHVMLFTLNDDIVIPLPGILRPPERNRSLLLDAPMPDRVRYPLESPANRAACPVTAKTAASYETCRASQSFCIIVITI
nr:hypothetical protein [Novosphingobium panipatense]